MPNEIKTIYTKGPSSKQINFMRMLKPLIRWTTVPKKLIIFLTVAVVCCFLGGSLDTAYSDTNALNPYVSEQEIIRVSGAWALYPMMVKWAEEFKKIQPSVRIDVSAGGAGKGMADVLSGLVDIGMVSRELRPEEISQNAFYVPVVKDAVFLTINHKNPVFKELAKKGLKKKVLMDLWLSGASESWGELVGASSSQKIHVYTRSDSCGAAETWAKYLGKQQEDLKGIAVYGDPGIAEAVRKDRAGIGYNNLNYAYDIKTGRPVAGLAVVPIDVNNNGRVDPGESLETKQHAIQAVRKGTYPSPPARNLYLVSKGNFKGPAKMFVK